MKSLHLQDGGLQAIFFDIFEDELAIGVTEHHTDIITFLKGIHRSKRATRTWGKEPGHYKKAKEFDLRKTLSITQAALERDPQSAVLQANLKVAKAAVQGFVEIQAKWAQEALTSFKKMAKTTEIKELTDLAGVKRSNWNNLEGDHY
ncbi:unnamed protein product [Calypogeia fissa]